MFGSLYTCWELVAMDQNTNYLINGLHGNDCYDTVLSNHCCGVPKQPDGKCHEGMGMILIRPIESILTGVR